MESFAANSIHQPDADSTFHSLALPIILSVICLLIGLFCLRPVLGDPDSYREALSAIQYIEEGTYGSYWDHALTMYLFVAATRLAFIFGWNQICALNALAALIASLSVWPFYQLVRRLVNWQTAAFATIALVSSSLLIRLESYLSHDLVGYTFALWSLYLLEQTLSKKNRILAFGFGLSCAATWTARPNEALFIGLPLLILLLRKTNRSDFSVLKKLVPYALLGLFLFLLLIYRPALVFELLSRSDKFFSEHYFFGRYFSSTTQIALRALTPALVALALGGLAVLLALRKRFMTLFCAAWIFPVYLFYIGMGCRHRYFLALLAPCLLLAFAAADAIDQRFPIGRRYRLHTAKLLALVFLLAVSLGPDLSEINWLRKSKDKEIIARAIGEIVGDNLLLATSDGPMINYYNRERPPQTVYFLLSHRPDSVKVSVENVRLVQHHLMIGSPVFATDIVIKHLQLPGFDMAFEPAWEYKSARLFRITRLNPIDTGIFGYAEE